MDFGLALSRMHPDVQPSQYEIMQKADGSFAITKWNVHGTPKPSEGDIANYWNYLQNQLANDNLEAARSAKQEELNQANNEALVYGYFYTINGVNYRFSFDLEAQSNFMASKSLLEAGKVPTVPWTAYKDGAKRVRLDLTLANLNDMELAQFNHKNSIVGKYNDLLINHLYIATSEDEINAITWG